jgi:hypothetical protein
MLLELNIENFVLIENVNIIQTTFVTNVIIFISNPLKNSKTINPNSFFFNVISK